MSANNFYLEHGYTPETRLIGFNSVGTVAVWTPRASARVAITALTIETHVGGTIAFYTSASSGGARVLQLLLGGSASISPFIGSINTTALDVPLFANVSGSSSNEGWTVSAQGFEMPSNY